MVTSQPSLATLRCACARSAPEADNATDTRSLTSTPSSPARAPSSPSSTLRALNPPRPKDYPDADPLRVAEDFATANIPAGGRVILAVDRAARHQTREVETLGGPASAMQGQPRAVRGAGRGPHESFGQGVACPPRPLGRAGGWCLPASPGRLTSPSTELGETAVLQRSSLMALALIVAPLGAGAPPAWKISPLGALGYGSPAARARLGQAFRQGAANSALANSALSRAGGRVRPRTTLSRAIAKGDRP